MVFHSFSKKKKLGKRWKFLKVLSWHNKSKFQAFPWFFHTLKFTSPHFSQQRYFKQSIPFNSKLFPSRKTLDFDGIKIQAFPCYSHTKSLKCHGIPRNNGSKLFRTFSCEQNVADPWNFMEIPWNSKDCKKAWIYFCRGIV